MQWLKLMFLVGSLGWHIAWAANCIDSTHFQNFTAQRQFRQALLELDQCMQSVGHVHVADSKVLQQLLSIVLENKPVDFNHAYLNFKTVLSLHYFDNLALRFVDFFEMRPQAQQQLFAQQHNINKSFYFYHDTGRLRTLQRGIALTQNTLFWRNLLGDAQKLPFSQIKSVTILNEPGLSFTAWKVVLNNNREMDIRLSQIPTKGVLPYISALIYFIHMNRDDEGEIKLVMTDKTRALLE